MMLRKRIEAAEDYLLELDDRAHGLVEPHSDTAAVEALDHFSKLGDQPELRLISATLILAGTLGDSDRLVRAGARMVIAHEAATFAKSAVKHQIDRTRPRSAGRRSEKKPKKGNHRAKELTSFPSGHSAGAIAAARAFSREYPEYAAAALAAAGFISAAQVPRRAHYVTDVLAGLAVGLLAEALVNAAWKASGMTQLSRSP
jgi:membrane-associated phospholipid phosphatase